MNKNERTINLDLSFLKKWQKKVFGEIKKHRYNILIVHRRAWKSVLAITYLIYKALTVPWKDLGYLWPFLNQTKSIAWEYLKKIAGQINQIEKDYVTINNSELKVSFKNGSTIRLFGGDNPDTLRWLNLSTIIMDEYADINPELYSKVIFPQINFHWEVGQTIILWTPKWKNHFYRVYKQALEEQKKWEDKWFAKILDVYSTNTLDDKLIEEAKNTLNPSQFGQEYLCSFDAAVRWSYYKEYIDRLIEEKRLIRNAYNPEYGVTVHFDLWIADQTSMVFSQYIDGNVYWIDYEEFNQKGFPFFIEVLENKWYKYDKLYLPHDAMVKELSTWTTRFETFSRLAAHLWEVEVVPRQKIEDGINAVKDMMPRLYVDEDLEQQLDRLSLYEAKWDEKRQIFTKPIHNEYSHLADAIRYMATTYLNNVENKKDYIPTIYVDYNSII